MNHSITSKNTPEGQELVLVRPKEQTDGCSHRYIVSYKTQLPKKMVNFTI